MGYQSQGCFTAEWHALTALRKGVGVAWSLALAQNGRPQSGPTNITLCPLTELESTSNGTDKRIAGE